MNNPEHVTVIMPPDVISKSEASKSIERLQVHKFPTNETEFRNGYNLALHFAIGVIKDLINPPCSY